MSRILESYVSDNNKVLQWRTWKQWKRVRFVNTWTKREIINETQLYSIYVVTEQRHKEIYFKWTNGKLRKDFLCAKQNGFNKHNVLLNAGVIYFPKVFFLTFICVGKGKSVLISHKTPAMLRIQSNPVKILW